MAQYRFLARDLEALKNRIARYDAQWRETLGGVHDSTTQSSETWHDNPQFDDVQQRAKMLETERNKLRAILADSELVEPAAPDGRVDVGSVVRVRFTKTGREERFVIGSYMVLDSEDEERISYAAPLAQLLMGHSAGESVTGCVGKRPVEARVLRVELLDT
ncbi:MAG TPA: GreA/GreB family elongation factor [Streptosporangiaceae bacterium]|jgi:transcription elongation GreA/GreB family factor